MPCVGCSSWRCAPLGRVRLRVSQPVLDPALRMNRTAKNSRPTSSAITQDTRLAWSTSKHDLALGKGFAFRSRGRLRLKGFDSPMPAFEVVWRTSGS